MLRAGLIAAAGFSFNAVGTTLLSSDYGCPQVSLADSIVVLHGTEYLARLIADYLTCTHLLSRSI